MKSTIIAAVCGIAVGVVACKFGPKVLSWSKEKISSLKKKESAAKSE